MISSPELLSSSSDDNTEEIVPSPPSLKFECLESYKPVVRITNYCKSEYVMKNSAVHVTLHIAPTQTFKVPLHNVIDDGSRDLKISLSKLLEAFSPGYNSIKEVMGCFNNLHGGIASSDHAKVPINLSEMMTVQVELLFENGNRAVEALQITYYELTQSLNEDHDIKMEAFQSTPSHEPTSNTDTDQYGESTLSLNELGNTMFGTKIDVMDAGGGRELILLDMDAILDYALSTYSYGSSSKDSTTPWPSSSNANSLSPNGLDFFEHGGQWLHLFYICEKKLLDFSNAGLEFILIYFADVIPEQIHQQYQHHKNQYLLARHLLFQHFKSKSKLLSGNDDGHSHRCVEISGDIDKSTGKITDFEQFLANTLVAAIIVSDRNLFWQGYLLNATQLLVLSRAANYRNTVVAIQHRLFRRSREVYSIQQFGKYYSELPKIYFHDQQGGGTSSDGVTISVLNIFSSALKSFKTSSQPLSKKEMQFAKVSIATIMLQEILPLN